MLAGQLYKKGRDGVLGLCVDRDEAEVYIEQAHIAIGNLHLTPVQTIKRVERMGVYFPFFWKDIY